MFVLTSGQILLGSCSNSPEEFRVLWSLATSYLPAQSRRDLGQWQLSNTWQKILDQRSCEGAREHSPHICTVVWFRVSSESARNEMRIRETHVIGPGHHHIVGIGFAADVLTRSALTRSMLLGRKKQKRLVFASEA